MLSWAKIFKIFDKYKPPVHSGFIKISCELIDQDRKYDASEFFYDSSFEDYNSKAAKLDVANPEMFVFDKNNNVVYFIENIECEYLGSTISIMIDGANIKHSFNLRTMYLPSLSVHKLNEQLGGKVLKDVHGNDVIKISRVINVLTINE